MRGFLSINLLLGVWNHTNNQVHQLPSFAILGLLWWGLLFWRVKIVYANTGSVKVIWVNESIKIIGGEKPPRSGNKGFPRLSSGFEQKEIALEVVQVKIDMGYRSFSE